MEFVTSVDQHPIYFSFVDNQPLPVGSYLEYFELGTNTPKTVYADYERTATLTQPVPITAIGRTYSQVFLGYGQYKVIAYRYNGDGIDFSNPLDYSLDHAWEEQGLVAAPTVVGDPPVQVSTIVDLRATGPDVTNYVSLMGYTTAGDKPVLTYRWVANSLADDDLGYVIRNPLYAVGAWVADVGPEADIRDYGVINNTLGTATYTHAVAAITYAMLAGKTLYLPKQTIQIPNTVSSLIFTCDVRTDEYAVFRCTGGGVLNVLFTKGFARTGNQSLQSIDGSGGICQFYWTGSGTEVIDPQWIGINYALPGTQDNLLQPFLNGQVTSNHPILVSGPLHINIATADIDIWNKLIFTSNGYLRNDSLYYMRFGEYENNMVATNKMISGAGSGWYINNRSGVWRTSWTCGVAGTAVNTANWINYQPAGTHIIMDAASTELDSNIVNTGLKITVEPGCLLDTTGSVPVVIQGEFHGSPGCMTDSLWALDVEPKASWFTTLTAALKCAWYSSATLDLESNVHALAAAVTLPGTTVDRFGVRNGVIESSAGDCIIMPGTTTDVNITAVNASGSDTFLAITGSVVTCSVSRCVISSTTFLEVEGDVDLMTVESCYLTNDTVVQYSTGTITRLVFTGCPAIQTAYMKTNDATRTVSIGSTWKANADGSQIVVNSGSSFTGNTFIGVAVQYRGEDSAIALVHSNNYHVSSADRISALSFLIAQSETRAIGIVVTNNTFYGIQSLGTGPFDMVYYTTSFGTWAPDTFHKINISGNTGDDIHDMYIRQTRGSGLMTLAADGTADVEVPLSNFFCLYDTDGIPRVKFNSATFEFAWASPESAPPTGVNVRYLNRGTTLADLAMIWTLDSTLATANYTVAVNYDLY